MYRKIVAVSFLLMAVIFLCNCATLQQMIQKPTVKFAGMSLQNISLFEGTLVFKFNVTNPNPVGATINALTYDLKINDNEFVKGVLDKGIRLKANGSEIVELPIQVEYLGFYESIQGFIESDAVKYDLSGKFNILSFDIPYHTKGNFDIPDVPQISLKSVEVEELSLMGASIVFALDLKNNNPFTVALNGLDYNINLAGTDFADGAATTIPSINGNGSSTVEIPLNVNFIKLGQSAYNILTKSSTGYEINGEMKFNVPKMGIKSFPFSKNGNVPLK